MELSTEGSRKTKEARSAFVNAGGDGESIDVMVTYVVVVRAGTRLSSVAVTAKSKCAPYPMLPRNPSDGTMEISPVCESIAKQPSVLPSLIEYVSGAEDADCAVTLPMIVPTPTSGPTSNQYSAWGKNGASVWLTQTVNAFSK